MRLTLACVTADCNSRDLEATQMSKERCAAPGTECGHTMELQPGRSLRKHQGSFWELNRE